MATQGNAAPVIIKRKKVVGGEGHHGGAWKVAMAFVPRVMRRFCAWLHIPPPRDGHTVVLTVATPGFPERRHPI